MGELECRSAGSFGGTNGFLAPTAAMKIFTGRADGQNASSACAAVSAKALAANRMKIESFDIIYLFILSESVIGQQKRKGALSFENTLFLFFVFRYQILKDPSQNLPICHHKVCFYECKLQRWPG